MSPSIRDLFAKDDTELQGGEAEFDLDKFFSEADGLINKHAEANQGPAAVPAADPGTGEPPPVLPAHDGQGVVESQPAGPQPGEGAGETEVDGGGEVALPGSPPPVADLDPLSLLPPDRRAALLALDQVITADPAKRDAVFGILSGQAPAQPPTPAPSLPEHIDPESFEAQLWRTQQEMRQQLAEISGFTKAQREAFESQRAETAANAAGAAFEARYAGKLTPQEVMAVAQMAGSTGIAGALARAPQYERNLQGAFEAAMEHVLWTNEAMRTKVIGTAAPPPAPPGPTAESDTRKRTLHALSSAASPVGEVPAPRSPLESRPDGRLTETSKQSLIKDLATQMMRRSEGA